MKNQNNLSVMFCSMEKEKQNGLTEKRMVIKEAELMGTIAKQLTVLSEDLGKKDSCFVYRKNHLKDLNGNRIFLQWRERNLRIPVWTQ